MRRRLLPLLLALAAVLLMGHGKGHLRRDQGRRATRSFYSASTSDVDSHQRATGGTCWDSATGTLLDLAIDEQCCDDGWCYYSPAVINRIANGTYSGVVAPPGTPTSWTSVTGPVTMAGGVHDATSACYTENPTVNQVIYQNLGVNAGIRTITAWGKYTANPDLGKNILLGLGDATATQWPWTIVVGHSAWTRISVTRTAAGVGAMYPQFGTQAAGTNMVTQGTYCADAQSVVRDISYAPRYCDGPAAGTVCAAELAAYTFTATELPSTRARIRVKVKPAWAATQAGTDKTILHNLGGDGLSGTADDLWLQYLAASDQWSWTAGGQTALSGVSAHAADAEIQLEGIMRDGYPVTLSVDGGAPTSSAGAKAAAALGASTGWGGSPAGADQCACGTKDLEIWTK